MRVWLAVLAVLLGFCAPAEAQQRNRFWLQNNTGQVIMSAFVSPSVISDWGGDILGAGVLNPGQRVWVTPNTYDCRIDVRVTYQGGGEDRRMGVDACQITTITFGGGAGAAIAPGGKQVAVDRNPSFTFVNRTGTTIRELYVSSSSQSVWGQDRLGANLLNPGGTIWIALPPNGSCTADMRVVFMNGAAQERRGIDTCSVTQYGFR
ncbi:hypothetical protein C8P66_11292 [Humitalea rosea]|uniref:Uncharacterized protein n=1 Tax=Humitalea rosea TaxID=990373 RepID=A0A2W7IHF8_9PROT|nr:Tat pathway signal protein [Humitalea rosea]PZW45076.1 hypothetical protein C8P66_11292 [Humitalea rosea]